MHFFQAEGDGTEAQRGKETEGQRDRMKDIQRDREKRGLKVCLMTDLLLIPILSRLDGTTLPDPEEASLVSRLIHSLEGLCHQFDRRLSTASQFLSPYSVQDIGTGTALPAVTRLFLVDITSSVKRSSSGDCSVRVEGI